MADFLKAHKRTGINEGGYANHPNDKGGETWRGIARNYHPNWAGWGIVDAIKAKCHSTKELNAALYQNQKLNSLVDSFYKKGFWDVGRLDEFISQLLAENVFDAAVHCGPTVAARFLQKALGVSVDGKIGDQTLTAANKTDEQKIVNSFIDIREQYHTAVVVKNPSQKVFLKNWISRCEGMRKAV
jgi:lysozyme family protein